MTTAHVHFGLSHHQSSFGMSFARLCCVVQFGLTRTAALYVLQRLRCLYSSDSFTNRGALKFVSSTTGMYSSVCLTNRAALGCISMVRCTYSSDSLTNSGALGCFRTATLHVEAGISHQESSSGLCLHVYHVCGVRTVSPTEQLWDLFQQLRCMYSSDCLDNRATL